MADKKYLAYLRVRRLKTGELVHSVGVAQAGERYVEKVMRGMLRNMGEDYYVDDSEVEEVRSK